MARERLSSKPLSLAVLVLLFERAMHPYEIAATLKVRHKQESIKLRYGSLYTVIEGLEKEGLIRARETARDGRRPERTVYELTDAGRDQMNRRLRELLSTPAKEFTRFEAGLSLMPAIPPDEAARLLVERVEALDRLLEETRIIVTMVIDRGVEPLYMVEAEYRIAMMEKEREFAAALAKRIGADSAYTANWRLAHQSGPFAPGELLPPQGD